MKEFYEYHQTLNEPWDGPAALVFSDGRTVGARALDRNGLRPARYKITEDGLFTLGSEVGTAGQLDDAKVIEKGRLGPGEMIAIDTGCNGTLLQATRTSRATYAERKQPYGTMAASENLNDPSRAACPPWKRKRPFHAFHPFAAATVVRRLYRGGNRGHVPALLKTMAETGEEAIGSMGDDAPLAVLSQASRALLYTYFKQLFAQVTNPADRSDPGKAGHVGRGPGRARGTTGWTRLRNTRRCSCTCYRPC